MSELTIRIEDARLTDALSEMASLRQRTVEAQVRELLEKAVRDYEIRLERVRRANEISAMTPKDVVQTDSVEIIREMREERARDLGG